LDISGSSVSDASVRALGKCAALRCLDLHNTPITSKAFLPWPGFQRIQTLDISGTHVDGSRLAEFSRCKDLKILNAAALRVDAEQIRSLAESCPLAVIALTPNGDTPALADVLSKRQVKVIDAVAESGVDDLAKELGDLSPDEAWHTMHLSNSRLETLDMKRLAEVRQGTRTALTRNLVSLPANRSLCRRRKFRRFGPHRSCSTSKLSRRLPSLGPLPTTKPKTVH
jgi:hypothetical protein